MHDWGDLEHFLAAAREGSFLKAARSLRVDQTTVARRVESLEEDFGVQLLDRSAQGLNLTAAGERAFELAERAEAQHFELESLISGVDQRLQGRVRVAAAEGFMNDFVLPRLAEFRQQNPGIQFDLVTGFESSDLLRRQADFAIRLGKRPSQNTLKVRKLGQLGWGLYASEAYLSARECKGRAGQRRAARASVSPKDLEWIVLDEDRQGLPPAKWAEAERAGATRVMSCTTFSSQLEACRAGFGVTLLPCLMAAQVPELALVPSEKPAPMSAIWLVAAPQVAKSARVRALMDYVADCVKREAALLESGKRACD